MTYFARMALLGAMAGTVVLGQVGTLSPETISANTISARPGAVNYIEGTVSLNGKAISTQALRKTFLDPSGVLTTETGKAEVLLTPGVFLRLGNNSEVRATALSLTDTQLELTRGEVMIEATGLANENRLQVTTRGATALIRKSGLYRFTADDPPVAAVLAGKARINLDNQVVDLKKGRELVLAGGGKPSKFNTKQGGDLFAWSKVRSEYQAAVSYRVAQNAYAGTLGYGGAGFGRGFHSAGWYWDNAFNSWAWLPSNGAFFNPFGYGFYSPGLVGYAPVVMSPLYGGPRAYRGPVAVPVRPTGWQSGAGGVPGAADPTSHMGFAGAGHGMPHMGGMPQSGPQWSGGGAGVGRGAGIGGPAASGPSFGAAGGAPAGHAGGTRTPSSK